MRVRIGGIRARFRSYRLAGVGGYFANRRIDLVLTDDQRESASMRIDFTPDDGLMLGVLVRRLTTMCQAHGIEIPDEDTACPTVEIKP